MKFRVRFWTGGGNKQLLNTPPRPKSRPLRMVRRNIGFFLGRSAVRRVGAAVIDVAWRAGFGGCVWWVCVLKGVQGMAGFVAGVIFGGVLS